MAKGMDELLLAVKSYMRITWDDDDAMILGFISRGMARLNKIAGAELDFAAEDLPRSLLLDYCRYANAQALEVFEKNYASELLALHLDSQAGLIPDEEGAEDHEN